MELVGGPLGVAAIVGVAFLVVVLAVLLFRSRIARRRKARGRGKSAILNSARVEVLETTIIDAERKLVLLRCDEIEHLVMVGGPADVVVENDVRKVRGPGAAPAKIPGFESEKRTSSWTQPAPAKAADTTIVTPPKAPPMRPPAEVRPAPAPARASSSVALPPRQGPTPASPPKTEDANRAAAQRPQSSDSQYPRREPAPPPRRVAASHNPPPPNRATASTANGGNERLARPAPAPSTRPAGRVEPAVGLPAAQIPWSDPDSIENEIVRALRFDSPARGTTTTSARREPAPAKPAMDSSATLGDLADRLEEALAREMQAGTPARGTTPAPEDFSFDIEPVVAQPAPPVHTAPPPRERERPERREPERMERREPERSDRRERPEPPRPTMAAAPEPEPHREPAQPERREETSVISLSSRRREAADPLEDEMARLLGELTSDTKGR